MLTILFTVLALLASSAPVAEYTSLSSTQPEETLCNLCEYLLSEAPTFMSPNLTVARLEQLLDEICDDISDSEMKSTCLAFVLVTSPGIYDALTGKVPPDQVCNAIHVCGSVDYSIAEFNNLRGRVFTCNVCEFILEQSAADLPGTFTLQVLQGWLDGLCSKLGKDQDACNLIVSFVDKYIFEALVGEIPPWVACTTIFLCPGNSSVETTAIALPDQSVDAVESTFVCELCEDLLAESASYIPKNATIAEVRAILKADCQKNFGNLTEECEAFVFLFATDIYDALTGDVPPEQVCTAIYMCHKNKTTEALAIISTNVESEPVCTVCEDLLKVVAVFMDGNFTEAELKALLDNGCEQLGPFTPQCEALVIL